MSGTLGGFFIGIVVSGFPCFIAGALLASGKEKY